ncbi:MAG TPA: hypothetical protein VGE74_30110 [Gemmata sp.]
MSELKTEKPRGFVCPDCVGFRLLEVYRTRRPARGRVVRYRQCSACGYREATEERTTRMLAPKKDKVQ